MVIYLNSIKKEYFTKVVFYSIRQKISIEPKEKIGIVGKNGEGKTTFLKILAGLESTDGGSIKIEPKRSKIAYLSAANIDEYEGTSEDFLLTLLPYLYSLKQNQNELVKDLNNNGSLIKYGELVEKYEKAGGYDLENKIDKVLKDLDLKDKNLNSLSGGEKSRLILAGIKIIDADLILLDEPTNHLDLHAMKELEEYIKNDFRNYIIISHDRKFLDNIVSKIIEISENKIHLFSGNYSSYKQQKESEQKQVLEKYTSTQKEINRLDKLSKDIKKDSKEGMTKVIALKNVKGKKYTNAQGLRLKIASDKDKMGAHYFNQKLQSKMRTADIVQKRIDRIEKIEKPKQKWGIKLDFNADEKAPDIVLRTKNLMYSYKDKDFVFPDIEILKNEKVAVIGPNGIGKTTLIKTLVGINKHYSGEIIIPPSVTIGYYSQSHEILKTDKNALENLLDLDEILDYNTEIIKEARNFLHKLLFENTMVLQKVSNLSQGEKSKLALAKVIYKSPMFLILDEPTNHLDIPSKERLEDALKNYKGTLLLISHDRYFMEKIDIQRYIELVN